MIGTNSSDLKRTKLHENFDVDLYSVSTLQRSDILQYDMIFETLTFSFCQRYSKGLAKCVLKFIIFNKLFAEKNSKVDIKRPSNIRYILASRYDI